MKLIQTLLIGFPLLIASGCASYRSERADDLPASRSAVSTPRAVDHYELAGGQVSGGDSGPIEAISPTLGQTATPPQSVALLMQLRQKLSQDASLAEVLPEIQIADRGGAITLAGAVQDEEQKNGIEALVRQTSGVISVNNNMRIADSAVVLKHAADAQNTDSAMAGAARGNGIADVRVQGTNQMDRTLAEQIIQELSGDASLASAISQVRILVNDRRVTLAGTVRNDVQKRELESAVQRATGVSSIDNRLQIGMAGQSQADVLQPTSTRSNRLERIYHEPAK